MSDLDQLLHSEPVAELLKNHEKLQQIRDSQETQQLFTMLSKNISGDLEHTTLQDTSQVVSAIRRLMQDPNGAKLIRNIRAKLE